MTVIGTAGIYEGRITHINVTIVYQTNVNLRCGQGLAV